MKAGLRRHSPGRGLFGSAWCPLPVVGVQLLERDSQGLELTSAGETLLARVRPERDRWLGPNVGPKRLLGTARVPGVAWPSVDGLEHGWPGSVGVVGAECHLFAGLVLGAL